MEAKERSYFFLSNTQTSQKAEKKRKSEGSINKRLKEVGIPKQKSPEGPSSGGFSKE